MQILPSVRASVMPSVLSSSKAIPINPATTPVIDGVIGYYDGRLFEGTEDGWVVMANYLITDDGYILNSTGGYISVDVDSWIVVDDSGMIEVDENMNIILEVQ